MPVLTSKTLFSGDNHINPDDLGRTEVNNFHTNVDAQLRDNYKWKGKATAAIGLSLSPDNTKVTNGVLITRGNTGLKEQRIQCDRIWSESTGDLSLVIRFPTVDIFTFNTGKLFSDIVPSSSILHTYHAADNSVILNDAVSDAGITDFAARMVCQLSDTSNGRKGVILQYTIILFPCSAEELADNPDCHFASFPGIKVAEGTLPLAPKPSKPWKCPVIPFIRPGVPFQDLPTAPSSNKLRHAVAAIMGTAAQPVTYRNGVNVLAKWARLRTHPRELADITPNVTWPTSPVEEDEDNGKFIAVTMTISGYINYPFNCQFCL